MTDVLFIAVNSSYTHTCPAARGLAAVCGAGWAEFNINQKQDDVLEEVYRAKPRIAAFCCYIWNIGFVLELAEDLKKILPGVKVLLGGPEVSFDARGIMEAYGFVDAVVCGEAEDVAAQAVGFLRGECALPDGMLARTGLGVEGNDIYRVTKDITGLPEPFSNYCYDPNRIYYYESSRGCPFSCSYCLSGDDVPLREKPQEQVKREIMLFAERKAKLVKFTDRTFNANRRRAFDIISFIAENTGDTRFHFEVALDLFDEGFIDMLCTLPPGKVQLEAGIQSLNGRALEAVGRTTDIEKVRANAERIIRAGNIHLHLDLIAGLPYEDMDSFRSSFNTVYGMFPHHLQLGFLKMLKGSRIRREAARYGIKYRNRPPYEALCTNDMPAEGMFRLKGIAELVERYYNTGRARGAIDYIVENGIRDAFGFFDELCVFCAARGCMRRPVSAAEQYELLIDFGGGILDEGRKAGYLRRLRDDYEMSGIKARMPVALAEA